MKKYTIFCLFILFALVVTSWAPAQATTVSPAKPAAVDAASAPLTITNNMPKATTVSLKGPKDYSFYVTQGATINKNIESGTYKYSYAGCGGKVKKGNLKAKKGVYALVIPACPSMTWTINNLSSKPFSVKLTGWLNYNVYVAGGQSKSYTIVSAKYDATMTMCGTTASGTMKFGKGRTTWTIRC
jgi:hypothetical protein